MSQAVNITMQLFDIKMEKELQIDHSREFDIESQASFEIKKEPRDDLISAVNISCPRASAFQDDSRIADCKDESTDSASETEETASLASQQQKENSCTRIIAQKKFYFNEDITSLHSKIINWLSYPLYCYVCSKCLFDYEALHSHLSTQHANKVQIRYRCIDCDVFLNGYTSFLNHVRLLHYNHLQLCCDVCNIYFPDLGQLSQHREIHNQGTDALHPIVYHCTQCVRVYPTKGELQNHFQITHYFVCDICLSCFSQRNERNRHRLTHNGDMLRCHFCQKRHKEYFMLEQHINEHMLHKFLKETFSENSKASTSNASAIQM